MQGSANARSELLEHIPPPFLRIPGEYVPDWNNANIWPLADCDSSQLVDMLLSGNEPNMVRAYAEAFWRIGASEELYKSVISSDIGEFKIRSFQIIRSQLKVNDPPPYLFSQDLSSLHSPSQYIRWNHERPSKLDAVRSGKLRLIQFVAEAIDKESVVGNQREPGICLAACWGSKEIIRWAFENNYPADEQCSVVAAYTGNMDCLKYVSEHQFYKHPMTVYACRMSMSTTQMRRSEFLAYCRNQGYPQIPNTWFKDFQCVATVLRLIQGLPEIAGWMNMTNAEYLEAENNEELRLRAVLRYQTLQNEQRVERERRLRQEPDVVRQENREEEERRQESRQTPNRVREQFERNHPDQSMAQREREQEREHRRQERARLLEEGRFRYPVDWQPHLTAREIVVNSGPDSGYQQNASIGGKCFDVGSQSQMHVRRYLQASADNIVVLLADGQPRCATRSRIQSYRQDNDHVFMPCAASYVGSVDRSIRLIRIPLDYNIFVPETDLIRLDTEQDVRIWQLVESRVVVPRTAALTAVDGHDFVSVSHCQDGTQKTLTRIIPVRVREQDPAHNRPNDEAPAGPRRSKRSRTSLEQTDNTYSNNRSGAAESNNQQHSSERKRKQPSRRQ